MRATQRVFGFQLHAAGGSDADAGAAHGGSGAHRKRLLQRQQQSIGQSMRGEGAIHEFGDDQADIAIQACDQIVATRATTQVLGDLVQQLVVVFARGGRRLLELAEVDAQDRQHGGVRACAPHGQLESGSHLIGGDQ